MAFVGRQDDPSSVNETFQCLVAQGYEIEEEGQGGPIL